MKATSMLHDPSKSRAWLERVRDLASEIRHVSTRAPRARKLHDAVVDRLRTAGLFRLLLPEAAGGAALDPLTFIEIIETLSKANSSAGWVVSQICVFSLQATCMRDDVVATIWGDANAVVANGLPAGGHAIAVDNGYRVQGRFAFSSGCRHATWIAAGAPVHENGKPRLNEHGTPELRFLFLRRQQVTLVDAWDVAGLQETGTDQFTIDDQFVPSHFTAPSTTTSDGDGGRVNAIPMILYFAAGLASVGLGIARDALDTFAELARSRTLAASKDRLADQPLVQLQLARAEAVLRSARAFLYATLGDAWAAITSSTSISLEQRALIRLASTNAMHRAAEAIDLIYTIGGTAHIFADNPIQRCFQDIHVLTQHLQGRESHLATVGQILLGNRAPQPFI